MITRRSFLKHSSLLGLSPVITPLFSSQFLENESFNFTSSYIKISVDKAYPGFTYFSTDSLGKSQFPVSPLLEEKHPDRYRAKTTDNTIAYYKKDTDPLPEWQLEFFEKEIKLRSQFAGNRPGNPLAISFSQKLNHCTALGLLKQDKQLGFPCILHFPGMGTFRVYCSDPQSALQYDAALTDTPFVNIAFPAATETNRDITYTLKSVAIYPEATAVKNDRIYDGFKKNFINIFQLNPGFRLLANNSTSDACAFTVFLYAEMARKTPLLVEGLNAFDLVRITLDRYLNGFVGYGMVGKSNWHSKYNSSDSFPSLIMAACYYILETKDYSWAKENYEGIRNWAHHMMATDKNGDGIIEYGYSGNANSWDGDTRPANWWDTIGFGHDDAYSNALAYRALVLFADVSGKLEMPGEADQWSAMAQKLKRNYYKHFYNPETGVLGGWRSADGKLHDYYFTFVNGIAITYGLVEKEAGRKIMSKLLRKMKEVGFTNFHLGLPGNLIPIRREDYIHFDRRWGYGKDEEGEEGFQIYENGGATGCYAYYTLKALYLLDMKKEADAILLPMLESFTNGDFEGNCPGSNMTKDWKTWKGECWGYEGFLVDNYLTLLAVVDV